MKKIALISALAISALGAVPAQAVSFVYPQVTGNVLMLGATERSVLTTVDDDNTTFRQSNGLQWWSYNEKGYDGEDGSIGFADPSATLVLTSCDTNQANDDVLCWHNVWDSASDTVYLTQGYRWDQELDVNDQAGTYRIVFTSDNPTYYPSGAQYDVPVGDLQGWTACWADDWGNQWGDFDESNDDLFAACDGDYLMLAVVDNVTEGSELFTVGGTNDLAETGLDVAPLAGVGTVALIVGAMAIRRRRKA